MKYVVVTAEGKKEFPRLDKKALKATISDLADDFTGIVKQHAQNPAHTDFTVAKIKSSTTSFKSSKATLSYSLPKRVAMFSQSLKKRACIASS